MDREGDSPTPAEGHEPPTDPAPTGRATTGGSGSVLGGPVT